MTDQIYAAFSSQSKSWKFLCHSKNASETLPDTDDGNGSDQTLNSF